MEFTNDLMTISFANNKLIHTSNRPLPSEKTNAPMLKIAQIRILLNIFRAHSIAHNAFFLEDMQAVYQTLSNLKHQITPKQKLRDYCLAETTTIQQLIGHPLSLYAQRHVGSVLPGKISAFIEELEEEHAEELLGKLIHVQTREFVRADVGYILLKSVEEHDHLLIHFLCAAGPRCPALLHSFQSDEDGKKIFLQMAKECNLGALKVFLNVVDADTKAVLLGARDGGECTALMYAVRLPGVLKIIETCLNEISPKDRTRLLLDCDRFGRTALWHAGSQIDVFKALLLAGADPAVKDKEDRTKLMDAILSENLPIAQALLEAAGPNKINLLGMQDTEGMTVLMHAARNSNVCFLEFLLAACETTQDRTDLVRDRDLLDRTALMFAAICNPAGVAILLAAKADPAARDFENKTALMYAARLVGSFRSLEVIPLLLDWDKDILVKKAIFMDQGRKALQEAIDNENLPFVQVFLSAAADVPGIIGMLLKDEDQNDHTMMMYAVKKGNKEIIRFLRGLWEGYLLKNQSYSLARSSILLSSIASH